MLDSVCDGEDNFDASWNLSTKLKNILYEIPCVNTVSIGKDGKFSSVFE